MEALKNIPTPAPSDRETVATALETAAAFEQNGNVDEALRWLKRAAQSAGEEGDDVRALALAHAAAELGNWVQHRGSSLPAPARRPPPLPKAPTTPVLQSEPPPSATRVNQATGKRGTVAAPLATRPPAPSSRPAPARSLPAAASARPTQKGGSSTNAPQAGRVTASAQTAEQSPASAAPEALLALGVGGEQSSVRTVQRPFPTPTLRQTARVAVVASPSERGLYLVRVLAEDEAASEQASEGLLTLLDVKSTLFKR